MKLVVVTQLLDTSDAVLGFVMRWIQGLSLHCERVRVLALEVGDLEGLPPNVDLRVIGRKGRLLRLLRYRRYLTQAFQRDGFDTLLTHMVPRYSTLGDGLARRHGAGHYLWYTHKGVDRRLRRAVQVVDKVFSASRESMRVETDKLVVTGHGIDLEHFDAAGAAPADPPRLLAVGRLTAAKDALTLVEALAALRTDGRKVSLDWAGGALAPGDEEYAQRVRARIRELDLESAVRLLGPVPYARIAEHYRQATLLLSASRTGSVDKVVLEAMACGRPPVTSGEAYPPLLAGLGEQARALTFPPGDVTALSQRVGALLDRTQAERDALGVRLRSIVRADHEVDALMGRLVREMGGDA
ncbi:MAG: glycosyltransferase [Planctomycetota bacterium]